jgi:hypothetical protein
MMDNRLAFVTHEFRTLDVDAPSVRAKYPINSRIVSITTNLDEAGARQRANEELATGAATREFEIVIQHLMRVDDFKDGPPAFRLFSPDDGLNGEEFRCFSCSVNLLDGTSLLQVRG